MFGFLGFIGGVLTLQLKAQMLEFVLFNAKWVLFDNLYSSTLSVKDCLLPVNEITPCFPWLM